MSSFLLPEVQKQSVRQSVGASQRRFLQAAHKEVYDAATRVIAKPASLEHVPEDSAEKEQ